MGDPGQFFFLGFLTDNQTFGFLTDLANPLLKLAFLTTDRALSRLKQRGFTGRILSDLDFSPAIFERCGQLHFGCIIPFAIKRMRRAEN